MHLSQMRPVYIQHAAVRRITLPGNRNSGRGNINCAAQTRRRFLNYTHKLDAQGKFVYAVYTEVFVSRLASLESWHIQFSSLVFCAKYHVCMYATISSSRGG